MSKKEEKIVKKAAKKAARADMLKWDSQSLKRIIKRARAQFSLQPVLIILAAAAALMLMTWLIRDVIGVEHIYAAAGF